VRFSAILCGSAALALRAGQRRWLQKLWTSGPAFDPKGLDAHSGDLERSIRSIMNTDSGDHEHLLALA
jgi:hypothetical protein